MVFSAKRDRYIAGLTAFRGGGAEAWIGQFADATIRAARLARAYIAAAAWAIIGLMPAHPMVSAPVIGAVTNRAKSTVYEGIQLLVEAGVLRPLSANKRNRWWEADGLLDLIDRLEAGQLPPQA